MTRLSKREVERKLHQLEYSTPESDDVGYSPGQIKELNPHYEEQIEAVVVSAYTSLASEQRARLSQLLEELQNDGAPSEMDTGADDAVIGSVLTPAEHELFDLLTDGPATSGDDHPAYERQCPAGGDACK